MTWYRSDRGRRRYTCTKETIAGLIVGIILLGTGITLTRLDIPFTIFFLPYLLIGLGGVVIISSHIYARCNANKDREVSPASASVNVAIQINNAPPQHRNQNPPPQQTAPPTYPPPTYPPPSGQPVVDPAYPGPPTSHTPWYTQQQAYGMDGQTGAPPSYNEAKSTASPFTYS